VDNSALTCLIIMPDYPTQQKYRPMLKFTNPSYKHLRHNFKMDGYIKNYIFRVKNPEKATYMYTKGE